MPQQTFTLAQAQAANAVQISGYARPATQTEATNYGHDFIWLKGDGTEVSGAFVGTGAALAGYISPAAASGVTVSVDGGAFAPLTITQTGNWFNDTFVVATGLAEGTHTYTLKFAIPDPAEFRLLKTGVTAGDPTVTVTGAAPALAALTNVGIQYTLSNLGVKEFVQNENGQKTAAVAGYPAAVDVSWSDESVRFKANCTAIRLWCFQNGDRLDLYVDDAQTQVASVTLPGTRGGANTWGWVEIATGLSGTHIYEILTGGHYPAYWQTLQLVGGTGLDTSTTLALRPILAGWGDSITAADIASATTYSRDGYLRRLARAKGYCAANRGVPSSTLKTGGIRPGQERTADITGLAHAPAYIIDLYGSNDMAQLGVTESPAQYVALTQTVWQTFLTAFPGVKILTLEILPRGGVVTAGWESVKETARAALSNPAITRLATTGWLNSDVADFPDQIHPSAAGYAKIATQLSPSIPANLPALTGITVTAGALDGQGKVPFTAAPTPGTASLVGGVWSIVSGGGSITQGGLLTPPAATNAAQIVTVRLTVGQVTGDATYTVPALGVVAAPTFAPAAGTYTGAQSVSISCATAGASVRYTLDGTTPSETVGTVYSGPVTVADSATLRAIAYKAGMTTSGVSSAAYVINSAGPAPDVPIEETQVTVSALSAPSLPALSTQRHWFGFEVRRGNRELDALIYGFEIAHYPNPGTALVWEPLHWDEASGDAYLLIGPAVGADVTLPAGVYFRTVRSVAAPHVAIDLPILMVSLPNP